jgi:hypothetical protein
MHGFAVRGDEHLHFETVRVMFSRFANDLLIKATDSIREVDESSLALDVLKGIRHKSDLDDRTNLSKRGMNKGVNAVHWHLNCTDSWLNVAQAKKMNSRSPSPSLRRRPRPC